MKINWRYVFFALAVLLLSLLALWTRFYYLLIGHLVLVDLFLTRKIDWSLRSYGLPRWLQSSIEWISLFILAIVFSFSLKALFIEAYKIPTPSMERTLLAGDFIFVSKLAYGPRLPSTPLALPFYHNTLPGGQRSYSEKISLPYKRLKGYSRVKRNDIIVFYFPEGDTMVVQYPGQNYYSLVRQYGREYIRDEFDLITHPVDKRENYIKRCIALPGDVLEIRDGDIMVNGQKAAPVQGRKYKYYVTTNSSPLPDEFLESLKILKSEVNYNPVNSLYVMYLSEEQMHEVRRHKGVRSIKRYAEPTLSFQNQEIFPHHNDYRWTSDNFGPLRIPARGDSIPLDLFNLPLYQRIIEVYEGHDLDIHDGYIMIDGEACSSYTFAMDYYFVLGDNHHNSADSRFWGFVPEDHLLGKAMNIWMSVEPEKPVLEGLRKERIFRPIN